MVAAPTTFLAHLLTAMQLLMTLDVPLSTTTALPVTSKPIESTVENSAWQAWIELPPEQKQQVKSRKVTPKSIFTLPLRVDCPEGHKQLDNKCIPIVIGTNDVLIDLNALGLLVGSTQTEDLYDYDDTDADVTNSFSFDSELPLGVSEKSIVGLNVELKPPSKDEPLKFNIFDGNFHIFHEEPTDDYLSFSNEGLQSSEREQNGTTVTSQPTQESTTMAVNVTAINDLASDISSFDFYGREQETKNASADNEGKESISLNSPVPEAGFKIDAISVPAFHVAAVIQNENCIDCLNTKVANLKGEGERPKESDIATLLQTESFLPLLNRSTATTLQTAVLDESFSLTTTPQDTSASPSAALSLSVDEEVTTLTSIAEQEPNVRNKAEFTRSVTLNSILTKDSDIDVGGEVIDDNDLVLDSALATVTSAELLETTTLTQLEETTVIETDSSLSFTSSTQQELKELLLHQEQTKNDFEKLQRMREDEKDEHNILKKSKVQPVEMLSTATEATTPATTTTSMTKATKKSDAFISSAAEAVTPLLTARNENDSNKDRFYYQHFKNQDNEVTQLAGSELIQNVVATEATLPSVSPSPSASSANAEIETIPLTSEIDLGEEYSLINESMQKGIRAAPTVTTTITTTSITSPTTTTSTENTISTEVELSSSSLNSQSESSSVSQTVTPPNLQVWSKIMPLLTASTTNRPPNNDQHEQKLSSSPGRSNRNSKIIRINSLSKASSKSSDAITASTTTKITAATTTTEATTHFDDSIPALSATTTTSSTTSSKNARSSKQSEPYDPYWWLPAAWRLDKPTSSEGQSQENTTEEQPLLLRFWSAYTPKSS